MNYIIYKLKLAGWYDFSAIPQHNNYIKVHGLNCGTDRKAINQAKRILGDKKAVIKIQ